MAKARKLNSVQSKIGMLLFGGHGAGKTTFSLNSAYLVNEDGKPFKIMFLDGENGGADDYADNLIKDGIDPENIYIVYTNSLSEVQEHIRKATKKEKFYYEDGSEVLDSEGNQFVPDMIIVDGSTVLRDTCIQGRREFSKKRATVRANKQEKTTEGISATERFVMIEGADIELKDYSGINFEGQSLALDLKASGLHYIITAREKEIMRKKVIYVNGQQKEVMESTGEYEPEGFKGLDYNVKTVARIYRDDKNDPVVKMYVTKDRTGTYPVFTPIEDPSVLAFQDMINKNAGREHFVLANSLQEDVQREMERTEREILGATIKEKENEGKSDQPISEENVVDLTKEKTKVRDMLSKMSVGTKQKLGDLLKEQGIPKSVTAVKTKEQIDKYIEIASSLI